MRRIHRARDKAPYGYHRLTGRPRERYTQGRYTSGELLMLNIGGGYMVELNDVVFPIEELAEDLDDRRWRHGLRFEFDHKRKRAVAYIA